jgi:cytochrome c-type biogenesis protein CcmF
MIAVALASSAAYTTKRDVRLDQGESATVAGYRFTYLGTVRERTDQKMAVRAQVRIERGGDEIGVYEPSISTFPGTMSGIATPSVRTGLLRDVYLTLISSPNSGRATIGIAINPMVVWLWIGGGVLLLGTAIALMPRSRRHVEAGMEPSARTRDDEPTTEPEPVLA